MVIRARHKMKAKYGRCGPCRISSGHGAPRGTPGSATASGQRRCCGSDVIDFHTLLSHGTNVSVVSRWWRACWQGRCVVGCGRAPSSVSGGHGVARRGRGRGGREARHACGRSRRGPATARRGGGIDRCARRSPPPPPPSHMNGARFGLTCSARWELEVRRRSTSAPETHLWWTLRFLPFDFVVFNAVATARLCDVRYRITFFILGRSKIFWTYHGFETHNILDGHPLENSLERNVCYS